VGLHKGRLEAGEAKAAGARYFVWVEDLKERLEPPGRRAEADELNIDRGQIFVPRFDVRASMGLWSHYFRPFNSSV
jgi:hypothetical protein